tara:strand:+ start:3662 stop:4549 length:888 start_codon:yes stop_codon:yes gene_type:complete
MKKFIILIPLFNDWKSVGKLLQEIDSQTKNWDSDVSVIIINDASTEEKSSLEKKYNKIKSVKILNMKKNQVHQRCIATGLMYVSQNEDFDYVIVMDADGEDRPEELNDFLKKSHENPNKTITGNRFKRSEGIIFRVLYEIHKLLTLLFAGKLIKFGNFTCLPKDHVKELIKKSYLWNSYSSSVVKTINDRTFIPSIRGVRYVLPSKMNFSALVYHSLTIISVFKKTVIIRSVAFLLVYLFLISSNFSVVTMIPVLLLVFFVLIIFKISLRANLDELNKSLENIGSIEVLGSSDRR